MPVYRTTFIFTAGRSGWSEQWYQTATNKATAIQNVANPVFATGFLLPRASGVILTGIRVNNVDVQRDTQLFITNLNAGTINPAPAFDGEEPNVAALGYCTTAGGFRRPIMLRGLIDAEIDRDADDNVVWTAALQKALEAYVAAIVGAGLQVRVLTAAQGVNPDRQVTSMAPPANDPLSTRFTYNDPLPLLPGEAVILHRLSRSLYPGYSGPLPAFNITGTTFDVPVAWRQPAVSVALRNTTVRNVAYNYDLVSFVKWEDMRTKRVGRPLLLSRGRRPGVKYRSR